FAALDEYQLRAADLVEHAARNAARSKTAAIEQGRQLVAEARTTADREREEAATAVRAQGVLERDRLLGEAQRESDRIGRVALERTPTLVNDVVQRILAL